VINGQAISVSAKAAVIRDGAILLVRYDDPHVHYNLPGGRLLNGESLRAAVTRKLRMECAANGSAGQLLFVYEHIPDERDPEPGDYQKVQFTFLAELDSDSEPSNPPAATDQSGVEWVPLDKLPDVVLYPLVTEKLLEALRFRGAYDPLLID
jgi:ADP-ribose pyrophosphatase YjhB (NUDIX family)